jgi:outer membrane protein assembly factor BamB
MSSDAPGRLRRRILLALAAVALLAIGFVAGWLVTREGDVSNPDVEFRAEPTPTPPPSEQDANPRTADTFSWPVYGYTKDRRRFLPASSSLRPPFKAIWGLKARALLEFPPVIERRSLYVLDDDGWLYAISKRTGRKRWTRRIGALAASSPAVSKGRLYVTLLERARGRPGRVMALRTTDGKTLWSRDLPSRSESSPLLDDGSVYFGSENGTVYALRAKDGRVRWTFRASGAVKGALAFSDGRVFFGDYAGKLYALRASDGRQIWQASTKGARFGFGSGRFYSTPAVAYGRVYIGNVDGYVYSFGARTGRLAWRTKTSGYVYASPAVGQAPGDRPTVYAGSYDGNFYAMDAQTGRVRWRHHAAGKISGGATLIGDIVYFADLGNRRTIGLGARTGRKVFEFPRGGYNPVVSDGRTLFLVGYATMHALRPLTAKQKATAAKRKAAARKARAKARRAARLRDRRLQASCHRRAARIHERRAAVIRSFRRCVEQRRLAATRRSCLRRADKSHKGRAAVRRSVRRCVAQRAR